jgi:hypothetical protein
MLDAVASLREDASLSESERVRLAFVAAAALDAVGKPREAGERLIALSERHGDDLVTLRRIAAELAKFGPEAIRHSAVLWRKIGAGSEPGSADWLAARLAEAEALTRSGQTEEASKLIRVTRLLQPRAREEPWASRFAEALGEG